MFSLESPHRVHTEYHFNIKKTKFTLNFLKSAAMRLKNEFKTPVVNKPSVFEPLKIYCISLHDFIRPIYVVFHFSFNLTLDVL